MPAWLPMPWLWLLLPAALVVSAFILYLCRPRQSVAELRRRFLQQREHLEAAFLTAASAGGRPRGLRWKGCEWQDEVAFARERRTGRLTALVAVVISFEAVEGGDMEGVEAVGNLRQASAVFVFEAGRWRTAGRAVFNLSPAEAIEHFKGQYEPLPAG